MGLWMPTLLLDVRIESMRGVSGERPLQARRLFKRGVAAWKGFGKYHQMQTCGQRLGIGFRCSVPSPWVAEVSPCSGPRHGLGAVAVASSGTVAAAEAWLAHLAGGGGGGDARCGAERGWGRRAGTHSGTAHVMAPLPPPLPTVLPSPLLCVFTSVYKQCSCRADHPLPCCLQPRRCGSA